MGTVTVKPNIAGGEPQREGNLGAVPVSHNTTANAELLAAPGANVRHHITQITVSNANTTTGTAVTIKDGTTAKYTIPAPIGSGGTVNFDPPLRMTANTAVNIALAGNGPVVTVSANGFKAA